MKKILILTPRFPYPVIGGDRLRIYEVCRELSKKYSLTLASLCETNNEMNFEIPNDGVFDSVFKVYLPKYKSFLNCLCNLGSSLPLQISYYHSPEFQKLVNNLASEHDMILPHLVRTSNYVKEINKAKILEMTDAISMNYSRVISTRNSAGVKGIIYKLECARLYKYETEVSEYFDNTVFVSEYDRQYLYKGKPDSFERSIVASNGVDVDKYPFEFSPSGKFIIFIGNLYSAQNYDAAHWFAESVMPKLLEKGNFTFKVIGRITSAKREKLESFPGVICTGSVDDVVIEARGAIAGVCSVRLAAGVQNKILEYMSLGIPAVTSSIGLEGLEAEPDKDILVADEVADYVERINYLDNNREFSEKIAKSARKYVEKHHSWEAKLKPLVMKVEELIGK